MTWLAIAALAAGTYGLKAIGPFAGGGHLSPATSRALALVPAALLAALAAVQTFHGEHGLALDARVAGVAAAVIALAARAPFIIVVAVAMAVTAALRI